jgi:RNA polymerase-binding transcription factor DksA
VTLDGRDAEVTQSLARERLRVSDHIAALQRDFNGVVEASESSNADDEHDPEGATIAFERAQVVAMLAASKARLGDIDGAIERLDRGTYGRCDVCGEDIAAERLTARPTATTCVRCMS